MTTAKSLNFIRCWAAGQVYALDMTWIRTIQRIDRLQAEDGEGDAVGWLEAADQRVMVWSLAERLGETAVSTSEAQRVIVLNHPQQPWGLLVEQVSQVETAVSDDIHLLPAITLNPAKSYFDRVIRKGDDLLLLLSPDSLHPDNALRLSVSSQAQSPFAKPATTNYAANGTQSPISTKHGQIVIFKLPGQLMDDKTLSFVLSIAQVPEVLEPLPLFAVPGAENFVQGLVNWRNRPVPIIDLGKRVGIPVNAKRNHRIRLMIVRTTGIDQLVGFMVDPAVQVVSLPLKHEPCERPLYINPDYILATVQVNNNNFIVPNMTRLTAV